MLCAVAAAMLWLWRSRGPIDIPLPQLIAVALAAFCGGVFGAKLPFLLADMRGLMAGSGWLADGKSIVSGLAGGYLAAMAMEWLMGIRTRACDRFAGPLALGIAIGRLGCYHAGCCRGIETSLPWGVDFGDGIARHPTQIYEFLFHMTAAFVLWRLARRNALGGGLLRWYLVAYFVFRFATEFIRPEVPLWLGLTGYQWAALLLAPTFAVWCCPGYGIYLAWRAGRRPAREVDLANAHLEHTTTLCPTCLAELPGEIYQRDGRVYLRRTCPEHGLVDSLLSTNRRLYYLRDEVPHKPSDSPACCCGPSHRTCVALVEITTACNLQCPICYADSGPGEHQPVGSILADVRTFIDRRGPLDVLQLSGGEPLLHPELLTIVDGCKALPIERLMINTNGLLLAERPELLADLARRKPGIEIYLQLDSLEPEPNVALRGRDLSPWKRRALALLSEHDMPVTLVCTVAKGVNDHELGGLLDLAMKQPNVRGITYQPATTAGRWARPFDPKNRATLADVVIGLADQSGGLLHLEDFEPLPCSHPNCCTFTVLTRRPRLPLIRIAKYNDNLATIADRMNFKLDDARQCCGVGGKPEDFVRVVVKPFMDAHTYDASRADECCVHIIQPGGGAVSFCSYNTLVRGRLPQSLATVSEAFSE